MKSLQILNLMLATGLSALSLASLANDAAVANAKDITSINSVNATDIKWPEPNHAWLNKGTFVDIEQLRRIGSAMNKDQVRSLISYPHFSEGFFHPRTWNYLFNFRTGKNYEYVTCQYQVHFDRNEQIESTYWRTAECAQYLSTRPTNARPADSHPVTLNADGMFAFDRSGIADLQPPGRKNLDQLAMQIKTGYSNVRRIDIIGYTDRFGSTPYNEQLSLARANTVKAYLALQDLNPNVIHTQGMGPNKPVVFCDGPKTPVTIACLMPNRRIEISVTGDK